MELHEGMRFYATRVDARRVDVFKITERRGWLVLKTAKVKSVWIPCEADEAAVAAHHGGYIVGSTTDWLFGVQCEPLGQECKPE